MFELQPGFLTSREADQLFETLLDDIAWQRDTLSLFGRQTPIPRMHQWYADKGVCYSWSGITMQPLAWLSSLQALRARLERETHRSFNSVLANLYRDGNDTMGWHADDEAELGPQPAIASVSLGAARDLRLRRRADHRVSRTLPLEHGSLLLMTGDSQRDWQHSLPRRKRVTAPRINLTFRCIM